MRLMLRHAARAALRRVGLMPIPRLPPPLPPWTGRPGGPIVAIDLHDCQVFFGYLRIRAYAVVAEAEAFSPEALLAGLRVAVELGGAAPVLQRGRAISVQPNRVVEFEIDALVPQGFAMDSAVLVVGFRDGVSRFPMSAVLPYARARDLRTLLVAFREATRQPAAQGERPRLLDVGGRARSYIQKSEDFPHCDVTVFDIVADPGVDVVGDAHELSRHFSPDSFDFAQSLAVFEHLLMPWKAAVELNRVLKPGGIAYVWAPQTQAVHDQPWDFFRFSDAAWAALFNAHTGFEILKADMSLQVHIVPRVFPEQSALSERTAGFMSSEVLVRKIGPARVDWPVPLRDVIQTEYPLDPPGAHPGA